MKTIQSLASIVIGLAIAWVIINMTKSSTFTLNPAPLDYNDENLLLVGAGLATAPPKPSVMDPEMLPEPSVVLMNSAPTMPLSPTPLTMAPEAPPIVVNSPMPMAPVPQRPMMMPQPSPVTRPLNPYPAA